MKETYLSANIETAYIKAWYDDAAETFMLTLVNEGSARLSFVRPAA